MRNRITHELVASILAALSCPVVSSQPMAISAHVAQLEHPEPHYYWRAEPVGKTAELLTLFCGSCHFEAAGNQDVPLISVLRDTLGDSDPKNDRVLYVWLLTCSRPNIGRRLLSAVPFFYWRVGQGSLNGSAASRIDLSTPAHSVMSGLVRDIFQWTILDQMTKGVRASSRAYRNNERDYEHLRIEEAISYLRQVPSSESGPGLTQNELHTILGRLELRKHRLGGLANEWRAARVGEQSTFKEESIRERNWELLRQCADKAGLISNRFILPEQQVSTGYCGSR
jgi:hypothetical protein